MDKRKMIALGILGGGGSVPRDILAEITAWQAGASRIFYAGIASAGFASNATLSGATGAGRTFISGIVTERCRQDGFIKQVKVSVNTVGAANKWRFKVFHPNGSNYEYVGQSELFTPAGTGTQTITLASPISCQPGDVLGVWMGDGACIINVKTATATPGIRWVGADVTTTNAFTDNLINNFSLCLEGAGSPPYLTVTGDSIAEGHDGSTGGWHSFYDLGPAGDPTWEVQNQLRGIISDGSLLQYQNHAKGGQRYSWVLSTGIVSTITTLPHTIIVHCGVNDVAGGRTWAQVEADLNAIKALLVAGEKLLIGEILPWTSGTDVQAGTIRTFNANLAVWCAANSATLIICHDAMGQVRGSTGEIDDLLTAYNQDGVHLTAAGVAALAAIWETFL